MAGRVHGQVTVTVKAVRREETLMEAVMMVVVMMAMTRISLESLRSLLLRAAVVPFPCTLLPTFRSRAGRRHRCEAHNGAPSPSSAGHCEMRESLPWSS